MFPSLTSPYITSVINRTVSTTERIRIPIEEFYIVNSFTNPDEPWGLSYTK